VHSPTRIARQIARATNLQNANCMTRCGAADAARCCCGHSPSRQPFRDPADVVKRHVTCVPDTGVGASSLGCNRAYPGGLRMADIRPCSKVPSALAASDWLSICGKRQRHRAQNRHRRSSTGSTESATVATTVDAGALDSNPDSAWSHLSFRRGHVAGA